MATMITSDCINCGACEPECPNNAISQGDPVYVIDPKLCTECVGFHDYEACAAVCPVDVCVTDPNNIESEEVLIARARSLHPETDFGDNFQSRFRKGAASSPAPAAPATAPQEKAESPAEPASKPAAPVAQAAAPKPPPAPPAPAAAKPGPVKKELKPQKTFPGELPISFDDALDKYVSGTPALKGVVRWAMILLQPAIGALPHATKKRLETALQTPLFTAAGSTAVNIAHNAVLYPLACMAIAAVVHGPAIIFTQDINKYILIGLVLAAAEGIVRLKDGIFGLKPTEEMKFLPSFYGAPLGIIADSLLAKYTDLVRDIPIPVDGFYSKGFVDKLERERRYGNVYTVEDRGGAYLVRMEFPRWTPDIGIPNRRQLPDEMPDYDYELALPDGQLVIKGKCTDERVRKISSSVGAFPPEFVTVIPLREKSVGFSHRFENKVLEVLVAKG
ncbi:MAG: YfhL family 4Fe-4S dicluster ferredoxin [Chloroflexota bacterium]